MKRRNFDSENKSTFFEWFIEDEELCKALINKEPNFLDYPITQKQKDNLLFTQIFPYKFKPDIEIDSNGYIMFVVNYSDSPTNPLFLISDITIWAFSSRTLIRTDYKDLRYDFMKKRISKILQDKWSDNWYGKMNMSPPRETALDENAKFYGVALNFSGQILK